MVVHAFTRYKNKASSEEVHVSEAFEIAPIFVNSSGSITKLMLLAPVLILNVQIFP